MRLQRSIEFAYLKKAGSFEPAKPETKGLVLRHVPRNAFRYTSFYHHLLDVHAAINLNRDITIRAVEDASCLKTPTVVCHAFDRRFVLAGEGHRRQTTATVKRIIPDARHTVRYRHRRQSAAPGERIIPDARYTIRYRHRRQTAATGEHTISYARHTIRDRHRRQSAATVKRIIPDARHTIRNRHRRQTTATVKHPRSDTRYSRTDFYFLWICNPRWLT